MLATPASNQRQSREKPNFSTASSPVVKNNQIKPVDYSAGLEKYCLYLQNSGSSEATVRNYRSDISQFLQFITENNTTPAVTPQEEISLNDSDQQQQAVEKFAKLQRKNGLTPATIRRKLVSINQYLTWMAEAKNMANKPSADSTSVNTSQANDDYLLKIGIEKQLNQYLSVLQSNSAAQATIRNYRSDIKQFAYYIRAKDITQLLTLANLKRFALAQKQKGLKATSIQRKLVSITQFATWAQRQKLAVGVSSDWPALALDSVFSPTSDNPVILTPPGGEEAIKLDKKHSRREGLLAGVILLLLLFGSSIGLYLTQTVQDIRQQASTGTLPTPGDSTITSSLSQTDYNTLVSEIEGRHQVPFSGKLYQAESGEQITGQAIAFFELLDSPNEDGQVVWESGACQIETNPQGIFDLTLGGGTGDGTDGSDCGEPLSSKIFYGNSNLWLSPTIGGETLALYPIKTPKYSQDSALLAGAPLGDPVINDSVLYMNDQGEILFADEPTFNVTEGDLTLAGENFYFVTEGRGGTLFDSFIAGPQAVFGGTDQTPLTLVAGTNSTAPLLKLGNSGAYIDTSDNNLIFYDAATGVTKTLTELATDTSGGIDTNFWSQSGTAITYAGGNVGVGTSTTEQALTVGGNIQLGTADGDRYIYFDNGTSANAGVRYNATTDKIQFSHDGSTWSDLGTGSGAITSVSNSDGTLTISPTTGAVIASLNLGNANTWTATQTFANLTSSGTVTLSGVTVGTDNTVLLLNSSNQLVSDEIDSRVWGTSLVDGTGQADYVAYWTDGDTLAAEQYLSTSRGGLGNSVTALGAGEILYSTGTTTYDSLVAGSSGQFLTSGGAGAPSWTNIASSLTAGDDIDITGTTNATIALEDDIDLTSLRASGAGGLSIYDDGSTLGIFLEDGGEVGIGGVTSPTAWLDLAATTTAKAQLNLTTSAGTDPTLPNSGDLWWNGTELYFYDGSTSNDLLAGSGISAWDDLIDPTDNLTLAMGAFNTTFNWDPGADLAETNFSLTTQGEDTTAGGDEDQVLLALSQTDNGVDVDQAADALLTFANADANDPVSDAIRFDAGGAGTDFLDGLDFSGANLNREIVLENGEAIIGQTADTITFEDDDGTDYATLTAAKLTLAGTLNIGSIGTGTTDSVIVREAGGDLAARTVDSRVWGTSLVDGTGQADYVAYWTDGDTLAAEQYLSTSRGGLGNSVTALGAGEILYSTGTTTYDSLVAGSSGQFLTSGGAGAPSWTNIASSLTAGDDIDITGTTNATIALEDDIDVSIIRASTVNGLTLYDDGGNLGLFVADQGSVGIGTDTPDSVLHVDVGAQNKNIKFSADATFSTGLDLFSGTQYSQIMQEITGELSLKNRNQDENIQFIVDDGGVLTTAMVVEGSTGEVGIGTSLPEQLLTVDGNIQLGITDADRYIYFDNGTANNAGFRYNATSDKMEFSDNGTAWSEFGVSGGGVTSVSNSDGTLTIDPTTGAVVASLNLGNINVWTALQTFDAIAIADTDIALTGASTNFTATGDVSVNTDDLFVEKATGDVGIGTTTPAVRLDVQDTGTAKVDLDIFSLTNDINAVDMDATETSILFNQYYYDATTPAVADSGRIAVGTETDWTSTASTQDSYLSFQTALNGTVSEKLRITSAGNVGIGVTDPEWEFTLNSGQIGAGTKASPTNISLWPSLTAGNPSLNIYGWGGSSAQAGTLSVSSIGTFAISPPSGESLNLNPTSTGNTFINNAAEADIEIFGSAGSGDTAQVNISGYITAATAAKHGYLRVQDTDDTFEIGTEDSNILGIAFSPSGSEAVRILDNGNVGIGDTSPDAKLEVLATTEQLRLTHTDDTYDAHFTVDGSGNLLVQSTAALYLQPNDDTGDYLTLSSNGTDLTLATTDSSGLTIAPNSGQLDITGDVDISSNLAVGSEASVNSNYTIYADETFTSAGGSGIRNYTTYNFISSGASWEHGFHNFIQASAIDEAGGNVTVRGIVNEVQVDGTSTLTAAVGLYNYIDQNSTSGQIGVAYGIYNGVDAAASTTISTANLLYIDLINAGTIGSTYGIYINDIIEGTQTNAYGIWANEGDWILDEDGGGTAGGTTGGGDLILGEGQDLELYHNGTDSYIVNNTGDLVLAMADTANLNITDGSNTLFAFDDEGSYGFFQIAGKSDTGDPATCAEGDIYYNAFDDTLKVCHSGNTWESLDGGGGAVTSVTNSDGTLTIDPTTGAVVASLNLGNINVWTALQTFDAIAIADTDIALTGASTNFTATGDVSFNTDDLFIEKTTGRIGIGDVSPDALLDVEPTGAVTTTSYAQQINNLTTNATTDAIDKYGLYISSTGTFTGDAGTATNNYGLYVDTPTGGDNNYAAIFEGGNVGVGTASPEESITTTDNIQLGVTDGTRYIYFDNGTADNSGLRYNHTDDKMQFSNDGTTWEDFGSGGDTSFFTNTDAALAAGSYLDVTHNQGTLNVIATAWIHNGTNWVQINDLGRIAHNIYEPSLIGWYKAEEVSGDLDNAEGTSARDLIDQGAPTYAQAGKINDAISLDGTDDFFCTGSGTTCADSDSFDFGADDFTIGGWFKHDTIATNPDYLMTKYSSSASADTGTGADGAITISFDTDINTANSISGRSCADGGDAVNYSITALTSTTATLESTPSSGCLAAGDEILVINLRGVSGAYPNTGNYETLRIDNVSTNVVTFTTSKTNFYGDGASDDTNIGLNDSNQAIMLQRVPNYTDVTISTSGTDFTPSDWVQPTGSVDNGAGEGGVMFFRASGTVSIASDTTINANAKGYIMGTGAPNTSTPADGGEAFCSADGGGDGGPDNTTGSDGPCGGGGGGGGGNPVGSGGSGSASAGGAGGGGGEGDVDSSDDAGGGGGGGYGALGTGGGGGNGVASSGASGGTDQSGNGGAGATSGQGGGGGGGGTYGDANLDQLFFGSSGGGGGFVNNRVGGNGGDGAGIVYLAADAISISGGIQADGSNGSNGDTDSGSGGGGAGGSIKLIGNSVTLGISLVTAAGSSGGSSGNGGAGGDGGVGRIAVQYVTSVTGSTAPTYTSTQISDSAGGYKLYMNPAGNYVFAIDDDQTSFPEDSATSASDAYDDNAWHHVVAVKKGGEYIKLYVDGEEVAGDYSLSSVTSLSNAEPFYLGVDADGSSNPWAGLFDEPFVYSRALSAGEVEEFYQANSKFKLEIPDNNTVRLYNDSGGTANLKLNVITDLAATSPLNFWNQSGSDINYTAGNVGIGTGSPGVLLHVNSASDTDIFRLQDSDGTCDYNPEAGSVTVTCSSDARLKTNIRDASPTLEYLNDIVIRDYEVIASGNTLTGVIAQEMLLTHPELVAINENGIYMVSEVSSWKLIKAIQELSSQVKAFSNSITTNAVSTQSLIADSITVAGQSLRDYIQAVVDQTIANLPENSLGGNSELISPVPGENLIIKLDETTEGKSSVLQVTNEADQAVLTIDNDGSLSTLGKLTASEIETTGQSKLGELTVTGDATVSGTLVADDIRTQSATVSGTLTANNFDGTSARLAYLEGQIAQFEEVKARTLEVTEATVSGTLYADRINNFDQLVANAFEQPSLINTILGNVNQVDPFNGFDLNAANAQDLNLDLADLELEVEDVAINASALFINDYFKVNGAGFVGGSLGVGQNLVVGDGIQIGNGAIAYRPSVIDENTVFYIQPERIGTLSLFGNLLTLTADGQVTIDGDLRVAGTVDIAGEASVSGSLLTNLLKPLDPNQPFQIQLAEEASQSGQVNNSRFEIIDQLGTPVATISASGAANFSGGVGVDTGSIETTSPGVFVTTKTAGKAYIPTGLTQVIVRSEHITADTLVYVTPLGSTNNQTLYVKAQTAENPSTLTKEGNFIVSLDFPLTHVVEFNWWIIQ